jgi:hypothetical protein
MRRAPVTNRRPSFASGDGAAEVTSAAVTRPVRFEEFRWLGDKRSQLVHDLDHIQTACRLDELLASEQFATFGPDRLAEARNRGYRPHRPCAGESQGE